MVQCLGGRGIAIGGGNLGIGDERLDQSFEVGILNSGNEIRQSLPELVNVLCSFRKVIGKIDFRFTQLSKLVDGELEALLVLIDQPLDFEEVILLKGVEHFLYVVPHFGFELAAAVPE